MDYLLENAPTLGALAASAGVILTVAIFVIQSWRARRAARTEARRQLVSRVLDTVDRAARAHSLYPLSLLWTRGEAEIAMVLPRLVLDLEKGERAVAVWVARQVQLMQQQRDPKKALRINYHVAFQLAEWHQGSVRTKWFVGQNALDPFDVNFTAPPQVRRAKSLRASLTVVLVVSAWAYLPQMARKALG